MGKKKISSLTQFLSEGAGNRVWVGVNVHKRSCSVAVCREDRQIGPWRTSSDDNALIYQLVSFGMDIQVLVYESGPTGFGLARSCQQAGIPVMVAAPSRIIRPISPTAKTDSLDCRKLAELARKDMVRSLAFPLSRKRHSALSNDAGTNSRIACGKSNSESKASCCSTDMEIQRSGYPSLLPSNAAEYGGSPRYLARRARIRKGNWRTHKKSRLVIQAAR